MDTCTVSYCEMQASNPDFGAALISGLRHHHKKISCKYFYDEAGSHLFDLICELPEYYQTRTEISLLERYADEIVGLIGVGAELVEFGAGSLRKVRILLDHAAPRRYVPIDISGNYLSQVVRRLTADYPAVQLKPVVADFTLPIRLSGRSPRVGFFPGGTIGNFPADDAIALLRRMRDTVNGGGLLIGVDLIKDPARLHAAYNDKAGVTAAFNKNLLARANSELRADFDLAAFSHYAPYNLARCCVEMQLVSLKSQTVNILGERFNFAQGETIHTEDSYKYTLQTFGELAARAGFKSHAVWTDDEQLFSLHWLSGSADRVALAC